MRLGNRGVWLVAVCGLCALAMSGNPRYVEELRVGGGFGDADGGADVEADGEVRTDGDLVVRGRITAGAPGEVLTSAEGLIDGGKILAGTVSADKLPDSGVSAGTYANATVSVDSKGRVTGASAGGGVVGRLGDLEDCNTAGAGDGQVLKYDETAMMWGPGEDLSGAGGAVTESALESQLTDVVNVYTDNDGALDDDDLSDDLISELADVDTAGAVTGQVLKLNANGMWVAGDDAGGGSGNLPTGGTTGQVLQWESSGTAKWVTVSGQAIMADGGAVTLQGSPSFLHGTYSGDLAVNGGDITANSNLTVDAGSAQGTITASGGLDVKRLSGASTANNPLLRLRDSDVNHGVTDRAPTDTTLQVSHYSSYDGGTGIEGFATNSSVPGLLLRSINISEQTGNPGIVLESSRKSSTSIGAQSGTSRILAVRNRTTDLMTVDGAGNTVVSGSLDVNGGLVDVGAGGVFSGIRFNSVLTQLEFWVNGLRVGHIGTDGAYVDDVS